MLGVFSSSVVSPPEELVAAGSRTPSPKTKASELVSRFLAANTTAVSAQVGDDAQLAFTHQGESLLRPSLNQHYGLSKRANESILVIEAYKALRDRAPHPTNHVIGHLDGDFSFVIFDKSTSTLLVASDQYGKVPLYWGITSDGHVAFGDDAEMLKGSCGKSLASFPQGCFYSTAIGELRSYENPKNKITAIPGTDEEMWGATFKVEGPAVMAATK